MFTYHIRSEATITRGGRVPAPRELRRLDETERRDARLVHMVDVKRCEQSIDDAYTRSGAKPTAATPTFN